MELKSDPANRFHNGRWSCELDEKGSTERTSETDQHVGLSRGSRSATYGYVDDGAVSWLDWMSLLTRNRLLQIQIGCLEYILIVLGWDWMYHCVMIMVTQIFDSPSITRCIELTTRSIVHSGSGISGGNDSPFVYILDERRQIYGIWYSSLVHLNHRLSVCRLVSEMLCDGWVWYKVYRSLDHIQWDELVFNRPCGDNVWHWPLVNTVNRIIILTTRKVVPAVVVVISVVIWNMFSIWNYLWRWFRQQRILVSSVRIPLYVRGLFIRLQ